VETITVNALLGGDGNHIDVAEARLGDTAVGEASALAPPGGTWLVLVVRSPGPSLPGP
jgi:hypothetical protein